MAKSGDFKCRLFLNSGSVYTCFMTLARLLNFSKSQFSHLSSKDNIGQFSYLSNRSKRMEVKVNMCEVPFVFEKLTNRGY